MNYSLKCYDCIHLINGDEPSQGGGCDNVVSCNVRPEVERAIRAELKFYGNNGSPFSSWQCGQTGIDVETVVYDEDKDSWTKEVESLRDFAFEAFDAFLASLPKVTLIDTGSKWMLRREEQIVEDVLWRSQKGRCIDYCKREDEDDILLQSGAVRATEDDTDPEYDKWLDEQYQIILEAELPESILSGHFGYEPEFGCVSGGVYHTAA